MQNLNYKNYNKMTGQLDEYRNACHDLEVAKNAVREVLDVDNYLEWVKNHKEPECPLSKGQFKAYWTVEYSESDELQMDDFVWEDDVHDFIDALRKLGAETLVVTNQSTALMENMHWFAKEGCRLVGLCEVESTDRWDKGQMKMGVRFAL